ncbi:hypothetical protein [Phreatobacter sp.]|uniref:hypothetical protein n=1 Tax=Phreatobacter sp. TaxID=1966341 RepID=UPI0022C328C1|nr:hypothetical protein [Phreatobacter sp.]MCZ8313956.1 hypothetical protein [Phreatobacter sp.]
MTRAIALALLVLALPARADPLTDLVRDGGGACFSRQFTATELRARPDQTVRSLTLEVVRAAPLKPGDPAVAEIMVVLTRTDRPGIFGYRATCVDPLPNGAGCMGFLTPGSAEEAGDTTVTLGEGTRSARLSIGSSLKVTPLGEAVSRVVVLPFGPADSTLELAAAPRRTCAVLDGASPD